MNKRTQRNRRNGRSGFTIIELGLVIVIALVLVIAAIGGYKKMYIPMKGDSAFKQISSVTFAIERTKASNDNVYPTAASAKVSSIAMLQNELGGAANSKDVADWTYDCSAGSGQTITLTTTSFQDATVAAIAAQKVNSSLAPWTAAVAGNVVTASLPNVTCN